MVQLHHFTGGETETQKKFSPHSQIMIKQVGNEGKLTNCLQSFTSFMKSLSSSHLACICHMSSLCPRVWPIQRNDQPRVQFSLEIVIWTQNQKIVHGSIQLLFYLFIHIVAHTLIHSMDRYLLNIAVSQKCTLLSRTFEIEFCCFLSNLNRNQPQVYIYPSLLNLPPISLPTPLL